MSCGYMRLVYKEIGHDCSSCSRCHCILYEQHVWYSGIKNALDAALLVWDQQLSQTLVGLTIASTIEWSKE